eukprot:CFRG4360T1
MLVSLTYLVSSAAVVKQNISIDFFEDQDNADLELAALPEISDTFDVEYSSSLDESLVAPDWNNGLQLDF